MLLFFQSYFGLNLILLFFSTSISLVNGGYFLISIRSHSFFDLTIHELVMHSAYAGFHLLSFSHIILIFYLHILLYPLIFFSMLEVNLLIVIIIIIKVDLYLQDFYSQKEDLNLIFSQHLKDRKLFNFIFLMINIS